MIFGDAIEVQLSFATSEDRHTRVKGRVRAPWGRKKGRLKSLFSTTQIYTKLDHQHLARVYDAAHPRARRKR